MSVITVSKGSAAFIEVTDPEKLREIYGKVMETGKRPSVKLSRETKEIVLTFNDLGEITIDAAEYLPDLEAVDDAGGRFYLYSPDPVLNAADPPPVNPPPPDSLCPC